MQKLVCLKLSNALVPATKRDAEILEGLPHNIPINITTKSKTSRSLSMHRMYWALIELALDYWEPSGGLLSEAETCFMDGLLNYLDDNGVEIKTMQKIFEHYTDELVNERADQLQGAFKNRQMLHEWIKEQAGYYDLILTPSGITRRIKSISFDMMSHEDWLIYYKKAFNVVWNLILSRVFDEEKEAQDLVEQLMNMAN